MSSFKFSIIFSVLFFSVQIFAAAPTITIPFKTDAGDPNNPWGGTTTCYYAQTVKVGPAAQFVGYNFWIKPISDRFVRGTQTLPRIQNQTLFLDVLIITSAGEWGHSDICHRSILGEVQILPPTIRRRR